MYNLMDVQMLVWPYSALCIQRPEVKLSHLHARPYSLRQGLSLIHRTELQWIYLSMLVLQPKTAMHISMRRLGFSPGFCAFTDGTLPTETSLHVLLRRTSGSNGDLWEVTFENFNKKREQQKYSFSKLVDIDYKYFFIFKCLREENVACL